MMKTVCTSAIVIEEGGFTDPNYQPFKTVHHAIRYAKAMAAKQPGTNWIVFQPVNGFIEEKKGEQS
jgi:hypothetical protein